MRLQVTYKPTDATIPTTIVNVSDIANLTAGNWYKFSAVFLNNGGGQVLFSGSVVDYGTDGLTAGATVLSVTDYSVAGLSALTSDTSMFSGFRGFPGGGSSLFDNFESNSYMIPEPSVAMLMVMGMTTFFMRRKFIWK